MQTYDFAQTVELLELVRDTPIFIPVLLTVFCGLRRGDALRWREVDLVAGYRIKRAQEFLRLGKGLSDDDRPRGRLSHGPDLHFAEVGSVHPGSQPAPYPIP